MTQPNQSTQAELLPCPWCGGAASASFAALDGHVVECLNPDCPVRAETTEHGTREGAVKAWNTRASSPAQAEWLPIAEAQKDRPVLGGYWYNAQQWVWGRAEYDGAWFMVDGGTPTHFLPIPTPPKETSK